MKRLGCGSVALLALSACSSSDSPPPETTALLSDQTLDPRPDYWASVLWRQLMGDRALDVDRSAVDENVRLYAHCTYQ